MSENRIVSWDQLQDQVGTILERLNADPMLARAAAVNPLLALGELGYEIDPQALPEIEDRLRFSMRVATRLRELRQTIFAQAGHAFDLQSADELARVLFEELGVSVPNRSKYPDQGLDTRPLPPQLSWIPEQEDPLAVLQGAHPIVEPLLEYRRLEASTPRLAPRALYDQVRWGRRRLFVERIRGRLQAQPG